MIIGGTGSHHRRGIIPGCQLQTRVVGMVRDSIWADLLLVRMLSIGGNGKSIPLAASIEPIQDVVEHAIEWDLANIAALGGSQIGFDMSPKRFGRELGRDTTHDWVPPVLGIGRLPYP
jgi:hypothetical protein